MKLRGEIILPGDKSISHRAAILGALSDGDLAVTNFGSSADCAATVDVLRELGVEIDRDGGRLSIRGVGKDGLRRPERELNCENSGTTMRLMAGVLAGQDFASVLVGDESLQKRPMRRVMDPLIAMGADVRGTDGHAPLTVIGRRPLRAIEYEPVAASAQLKSCVLLAGLNADGETSVLERTPTRDHTERMLRWLGADVREEPGTEGVRISVSGDARLHARDIHVPSDLSSAAFFIVAAGLLDGSEISMPGVGVNGSRRAVVDVLQQIGVDVRIENERSVCNEPVADLTVHGRGGISSAGRNLLSGGVIANLIDEIPILAIAGTQIEGGLEVRDAGELRIKESDRIAAVVGNLRLMGGEAEEFEDGFRVGRSDLHGAKVDSFGDHRIAMAFAVAALFAEGETEIAGADCAAVSFPAFYEELERVKC
ncbi:MAG: 3-phosphoshikimate 1-carboxyvinyltransferase [Pyrinomonadaceae bacterium]